MLPLADVQDALRRAIVDRDAREVAPLLAGGPLAARRLEIHSRHYEASLVTALLTRFPASAWLVGSAALVEAAHAFVCRHPPDAPCIAEYGGAFPRCLEESALGARLPYLGAFATLEWHVGQVSIAVDQPALSVEPFSRASSDALAAMRVDVQPGVRYLRADWPIDRLMTIYVSGDAPDRLSFEPEVVRLEIRGARGEFRWRRLDSGTFAFRQGLQGGLSIGDAADRAWTADAGFDPGAGLLAAVSDGLVAGIPSGDPDPGEP